MEVHPAVSHDRAVWRPTAISVPNRARSGATMSCGPRRAWSSRCAPPRVGRPGPSCRSPYASTSRPSAGARVTDAWSAGTGFTPGFASRLTLANGHRIFVKAAGDPDDRLHGWQVSDAYREEVRKHRAFGPGMGAPELLWSDDTVLDGERWVMLGLQYVDGRPPRRPWRPRELALVLDTLTAVAPALAQPPAELHLPTVEDDLVHRVEQRLQQISDLAGPNEWLDTVARLCAESALIAGDSMVHLDLRDDNVLVTDAGQVWFVDWNFPVIGARWIDLVCILLSAHGDGLDADAVLARHPLTRDVDPHAVDVLLAVLWSHWGRARTDPVPTRSPHLRDHQTWYAEVTQDWLLARLRADRGDRAAGASGRARVGDT